MQNHCNYSKLDIPTFIIIGLEDELDEFNEVIGAIELPPEIDMNNYFNTVLYLIIITNGEDEFIGKLQNTIESLYINDTLHDIPRLDEYEFDLAQLAVVTLGVKILHKLNELNIFIDGHCPYSFHKRLGDSDIILKYSDVEFN